MVSYKIMLMVSYQAVILNQQDIFNILSILIAKIVKLIGETIIVLRNLTIVATHCSSEKNHSPNKVGE